jgi:hypothetical protein
MKLSSSAEEEETPDRPQQLDAGRVTQLMLVPTSAQTSLSSPGIWVFATSATARS